MHPPRPACGDRLIEAPRDRSSRPACCAGAASEALPQAAADRYGRVPPAIFWPGAARPPHALPDAIAGASSIFSFLPHGGDENLSRREVPLTGLGDLRDTWQSI